MAYRVLMILPTLYRKWAATRLHTLYEWVPQWANEAIYAGIPGLGAADGWFQTAITLEHCHITNTPFIGGAVDILKCFDQIHRDLLYALCQKAGLPARILLAYRSFHENLQAYNSIAGALGQPYTKPASIPQGCPLSMVLIAPYHETMDPPCQSRQRHPPDTSR